MRVKTEDEMLGKRFIAACESRGGALAKLAISYRRADGDVARARVEKRLRAVVPADLAVLLYMSDIGRRGGSKTSARKAETSKANGARGGRPVAKEAQGRKRRPSAA